MKFLHYIKNDEINLAVKTDEGVFSLKDFSTKLPSDLNELLKGGKEAVLAIEAALKGDKPAAIDEENLVYAPAVPNPEKILCIGLNYYAHGKEIKMKIPETPTVFSKFNNALAAHNSDIKLPDAAFKFDYEAELVIVIGKEGKNIKKEEALDHVFGYTIGNDVSARDLQMLTGQWLIGKTCDGFAPMGPYIVTADEIEPQNLEIGCKVNGETVQLSNTSNMIFDCAFIISYISQYITLKPGDVIFTGTPSGVILGKAPEEQVWLKAGDEMEIFIEKLGSLKNKLI